MPHATMDLNMDIDEDDDLFGDNEDQALDQPENQKMTGQDEEGGGQHQEGGFQAEGDQELDDLMKEGYGGGALSGDTDMLNVINDRELEIGEKADDAIDYADFSDDDLPEEEFSIDQDDRDKNNEKFKGDTQVDQSQEIGDDLDDLFGDEEDEEDEEDEDVDPEYLEQQRLFAIARGQELPPPPQTSKEYFDRIWPNFEPDQPPRFASLLPKKRAFFVPKTPVKPPKPVQLNKVSLDLAADQEKAFRLPSVSATTNAGRQLEEEQRGIMLISDETEEVNEDEDVMELDTLDDLDEKEPIGTVSWNDLKIACEDWSDDDDGLDTPPDIDQHNGDWILELLKAPPRKKRRLGDAFNPVQFSVYDHIDFPSWDDPEEATAKLSKKIILDMNDPHILLDVQQPNAEQRRLRTTTVGLKRDNRGSLANPMFKRYNISNDEAYDALKENSQQKVRSTLGHMSIEHSLPALKLQYPFYKVNLSDRELRSFHRPTIHFKPGERVSIEPYRKDVKRKHKKNLKPMEAFAIAEDLNIGDTSDLLLAEYSEEYPTTLSNHGMGSKVVNYYRRKDNEDTSRPKQELGETMVLLPQDTSPFSIFGTVEPGQTVPTLLNAMYRAPIFQHQPKQTDFLVSRSHTGVHGSRYFMRNIQNLVVVGQEFPSVEVPGTHARKVTEASKKRLKMLAFRLYRKGQQRGARQPWVSNEMIKHHLPGTEIAQNRSRMREIMKYEKETGTWKPQDGETIPDEPSLRTWIKPEDICLIDSMHAGDRHLTDAGFKANEIKDDEDGEGGENLELKLAPWHTTKNFLNACQGKAMLELHGAGDPTARGEAFSFIKVSMKGGFKDVGESVGDRLDSKNRKELGGHSYNVAQQQKRYEDAIQRIWNKQTESLSSSLEHSDVEMDNNTEMRPNGLYRSLGSEFGTPRPGRDDETMSQFSRNSNQDIRGKKLRIKRFVRNRHGEMEESTVTIDDPEVIKLYTKRKKQEQLEGMSVEAMNPTGILEFDQQQRMKLEAELARLKRNVERREGREKAKGIHVQSSIPGTPGANGAKGVGATPRKCANCGEVGHIKTNKKLCPLLNGQKKQSDTFKDANADSPATVSATPFSATTPQFSAGSPL